MYITNQERVALDHCATYWLTKWSHQRLSLTKGWKSST